VTEPVDESSAASPAALSPTEFDCYRLAVEMADRVSARRGVANSFFLTINTAVTAGLSATGTQWYLAAAGVVLSISWWVLLTSYRKLNAAKFSVVLELERELPVRIYTDEWAVLQRQPSADTSQRGVRAYFSRYQELGKVERIVPWVFVALYLVELARAAA